VASGPGSALGPAVSSGGAFPVQVVDRGKFASVTQDPNTGAITVGPASTVRTPWYNQTDFNVTQSYKLSESKTLGFSATITNLLNERAVTALQENITSGFSQNYIAAGVGGPTLFSGVPFYVAALHPYDFVGALNSAPSNSTLGGTGPGPVTVNSGYGQPNRYQAGRTIRLGVRFTF